MASTEGGNGANLGFEEKLWKAADKLRGHMDASEYKHVVLGLTFLKYISDSFEEKRAELRDQEYADPEDRDEYLAENVFWVPKEARWEQLQAKAKSPEIGKIVDDAMVAIEEENPQLKGVLPKRYARPALNKQKLGELIDLIAGIGFGSQHNGSSDVLGRVYEYFLGKFAANEGKSGGEFYTPESVVKLLVEMIEPYKGRIYDPCCGSGGMFVQSEKFVESHGGKLGDLAIYGQESNPTTWKLCKMNLAIRGIESDLGGKHADTFHNNVHPDLKADYILANPPFNLKDWGKQHLEDDARWNFGVPPANNANYAWIQHIFAHLAPSGRAGFVMANGSLTSMMTNEATIRESLVTEGVVEAIVGLPDKLFYTTGIPVSIWIIRKPGETTERGGSEGGILFIDATAMGALVERTLRALSSEEISRIAGTYHTWVRGEQYSDIPGFCKMATIEEVAEQGYVLTPGRYVGMKETTQESPDFEKHFSELIDEWGRLREQGERLNEDIESSLGALSNGH